MNDSRAPLPPKRRNRFQNYKTKLTAAISILATSREEPQEGAKTEEEGSLLPGGGWEHREKIRLRWSVFEAALKRQRPCLCARKQQRHHPLRYMTVGRKLRHRRHDGPGGWGRITSRARRCARPSPRAGGRWRWGGSARRKTGGAEVVSGGGGAWGQHTEF